MDLIFDEQKIRRILYDYCGVLDITFTYKLIPYDSNRRFFKILDILE